MLDKELVKSIGNLWKLHFHILACIMWNIISPAFLFTLAYQLVNVYHRLHQNRPTTVYPPPRLGHQVLCESGCLPFWVIHCYLSLVWAQKSSLLHRVILYREYFYVWGEKQRKKREQVESIDSGRCYYIGCTILTLLTTCVNHSREGLKEKCTASLHSLPFTAVTWVQLDTQCSSVNLLVKL